MIGALGAGLSSWLVVALGAAMLLIAALETRRRNKIERANAARDAGEI